MEDEAYEDAREEARLHSGSPGAGGRGRDRTSTMTWKFDVD